MLFAVTPSEKNQILCLGKFSIRSTSITTGSMIFPLWIILVTAKPTASTAAMQQHNNKRQHQGNTFAISLLPLLIFYNSAGEISLHPLIFIIWSWISSSGWNSLILFRPLSNTESMGKTEKTDSNESLMAELQITTLLNHFLLVCHISPF